MVYTRNQKRKTDDNDDNGNVNGNVNGNNINLNNPSSSTLQVNEIISNITITKRKKSSYSGDNEDSNSNSNSNINEDESDYESSFKTQTDTESEDISMSLGSDGEDVNENVVFGEDDDFETYEEEDDGNKNDKTKKTNIKLKNEQIQKIIKDAVENLIKKGGEMDDDKIKNIGNPYDKFEKYMDLIYSGKFFERVPLEDKTKKLKSSYDKEEITLLNEKLDNLKKTYAESAPSIIDILKMDIDHTQKQKLLEKLYVFSNSELLTHDYNSTLKYLLTNINNNDDKNLVDLEKKILSSVNSDELNDNYRKKILKSNMSFENKVIAYKRHEIMDTYADNDNSEYAKYKAWMDTLLSVPFEQYVDSIDFDVNKQESDSNAKEYLKNVRGVLDRRLSFLEKPKDQIINIVSQMMRNPNFPINAIGLCGNAGLGKTSLVKSIAEALDRPYKAISLGGESDASLLTGHGFTYIGSNPGRLIEILRETKCMNPVVLIDELDKVSQTHQGKEIIGTLIHLTDYTTNNKYNYDRYFSGIEFDLSKVLFVFTYNDPSKVDKILLDRLYKIKVDNYTFNEKLEITNKHLIKNILEEYNLTSEQVNFTEDAITYIVHSSKSDDGMRNIKRKFEIIISRINTLILTNEYENGVVVNNIVKLKYKSLSQYYTKFPVIVPKEHIDILLEDSITSDGEITPPPFGMYT